MTIVLHFYLVISCLLVGGFICNQHIEKNQPRKKESRGIDFLKGYELYSWEKDEDWYFSILSGTNRAKSIQEITDSSLNTSIPFDVLVQRIDFLPISSQIFWSYKNMSSNKEHFDFPPDSVILKLEQICLNSNLSLHVIK